MNTFKLSKLLLLLLCLASGVTALADDEWNLVVTGRDGADYGTYLVSTRPEITFNDGMMIITTDVGMVIDYNLPHIQKLTYRKGNDSMSSVNDIFTGEPMLKLEGESLVFNVLNANSSVSIYNINGVQVLNRKLSEVGYYSLSLSSLSTGVYIVNVNGSNYKIIKK